MIEWNVSNTIDANEIQQMGWCEGVVPAEDNTRGTTNCLRRIPSRTINDVEDLIGINTSVPEILSVNPSSLSGRFSSRQETTVKQLISVGCVFEVIFAPTLGNRTVRQNFIDILRQLVKLTKAKHLIISSGASNPHHLRRPEDFANLFCLAGIPYSKGINLVTNTNNFLKKLSQTPLDGVIITSPDSDLEKPAAPIDSRAKRRKADFSSDDSSSESSSESSSDEEEPTPTKKATFDCSESDSDSNPPLTTKAAVKAPLKTSMKVKRKR
eukprot:TRINITY_DN23411_c0_g1_i1.p1 TRINITY_DN23411_c0_g1~~TRINITY_DN23411_c0_g1_i1.p1  ORF type:complete len:268 (+),score=55.58 TRINITY_DN23411_c0_g1_i1:91-894(+)